MKGNNKQVDHMIAAKRAWSLFYEVEKPLLSHGHSQIPSPGLENSSWLLGLKPTTLNHSYFHTDLSFVLYTDIFMYIHDPDIDMSPAI